MMKKLKQQPNKQLLVAVFVMLVVVSLGIYLRPFGHAAIPVVAVEVETSGSVTPPASKESDVATSGGGYIKFGTAQAPPATSPLLGFYPAGAGSASSAAFLNSLSQTYLGVPHVSLAETFITPSLPVIANPNYVWSAYDGSPYRLIVSLPTLATDSGATYATCATGAYDSYYASLGKNLVSHGHSNAIIRLGWEFNYNFSSFFPGSDPANYISCFRREVTSLRSASGQNFKIDWTTNNGKGQIAPDLAYPGDAYVDIVGVDAYDVDWNVYNNYTGDHVQAWKDIVGSDTSYGLKWQVNFANTHHKLLSIPEWGVGNNTQSGHIGGDDPYYIQQMSVWLTTNHYYYANYFWQSGTSVGNYALTLFPNAAAAFTQYFTPLAATPRSD